MLAGKGKINASTAPVWGEGAYPLRDAARLVHITPQTERRWIEGYGYTYKGRRLTSPPVAHLARERPATAVKLPRSFAPNITFEQLLTLMLVRAFKERGLSLPKIKAASARAKAEYGLENPFVSRQFRSDGKQVLLGLDPAIGGKERELIDVLSDQRQFRDIVEPSLFTDVVFIGDRAGQWWPLGPARAVVLIPTRQFGAPHIAGNRRPHGRHRPDGESRRRRRIRPRRRGRLVRPVPQPGGGRGGVRRPLAIGAAGLIFVLDQNLNDHLLAVLRMALVWPEGQLTSLVLLCHKRNL